MSDNNNNSDDDGGGGAAGGDIYRCFIHTEHSNILFCNLYMG